MLYQYSSAKSKCELNPTYRSANGRLCFEWNEYHSDIKPVLAECKYQKALNLITNGSREQAVLYFKSVIDFWQKQDNTHTYFLTDDQANLLYDVASQFGQNHLRTDYDYAMILIKILTHSNCNTGNVQKLEKDIVKAHKIYSQEFLYDLLYDAPIQWNIEE